MVSALTVNNTRPITDAQPHAGDILKCLHIASAGRRERCQFKVDLRTGGSGKLAPLASGSGSKRDFRHTRYIALCDIIIKQKIA
jgi:hypothetical protein